jgi:ABC-2 type transport system permease protein
MTQQTTSTPADGSVARRITTAEGVRLIAKREIGTALRSKAMVWSFISVVAFVALAILGGRYFGDFMSGLTSGGSEDQTIGTTIDSEQLPPGLVDGAIVEYASIDEAVADVESGDLDALITTGADAAGIELFADDGTPYDAESIAQAPGYVLIGLDGVPESLSQGLTLYPVTASLEVSDEGIPQFLMMFVALAFGLVFFLSIMLYAQRLSQSIVEEKASRIVELLVSTVRPSTILAGKIVGGTVMAITQVVLIVAVALICLSITGNLAEIPDIGVALIWFGVLTLLGFMFYASMYAALSATVSRPEDVASATAPLTYLLMIPYIGPMLGFQNDTFMWWLSYIPFSSPVATPLRLLQGNAAWWEPVAATAVMVAFVVGVIWLAGRIYRNSVLRTGGKVKLSEALKSQ